MSTQIFLIWTHQMFTSYRFCCFFSLSTCVCMHAYTHTSFLLSPLKGSCRYHDASALSTLLGKTFFPKEHSPAYNFTVITYPRNLTLTGLFELINGPDSHFPCVKVKVLVA